MTNSKELFNELVNRVQLDESKDEIQSIIYLLLEEKLGLAKMDIMMGKNIELIREDQFNEYIQRINRHEPIQYIVGHAEFYGRQFAVDHSVLIPRPETELLITSVIRERVAAPVILDMGTGSGCIAVTLAKEIPSKVYAIDISEAALAVAQQNAMKLQAAVNFSKADILSNVSFDQHFDFILSNPPYIAVSEKVKMNTNVLDFEPHVALFVSDDDPLIFYSAIARKRQFLKPNGKIMVEINERFGQEVAEIFRKAGFHNVTIEKDINSKDRVVVAEHF